MEKGDFPSPITDPGIVGGRGVPPGVLKWVVRDEENVELRRRKTEDTFLRRKRELKLKLEKQSLSVITPGVLKWVVRDLEKVELRHRKTEETFLKRKRVFAILFYYFHGETIAFSPECFTPRYLTPFHRKRPRSVTPVKEVPPGVPKWVVRDAENVELRRRKTGETFLRRKRVFVLLFYSFHGETIGFSPIPPGVAKWVVGDVENVELRRRKTGEAFLRRKRVFALLFCALLLSRRNYSLFSECFTPRYLTPFHRKCTSGVPKWVVRDEENVELRRRKLKKLFSGEREYLLFYFSPLEKLAFSPIPPGVSKWVVRDEENVELRRRKTGETFLRRERVFALLFLSATFSWRNYSLFSKCFYSHDISHHFTEHGLVP
ncbi:hypothetical protein CEXT_295171 [Caerostris extrusa]|uniref:Uncharacterized protein n=1 Tax=Caerostris extrusa TaxID=172846 RepID=A0AAV4M8G0_CAEEX|nr:hypothetical protein CEXT_295171 [Caerostris extrusa]